MTMILLHERGNIPSLGSRIGFDPHAWRADRATRKISAKSTRFDHQYLDVKRSELLRERLGKALERELRSTVRPGTGDTDQSRHRRDVDDHAAVFAQFRDRGACDAQRTEEIRLHDGANRCLV